MLCVNCKAVRLVGGGRTLFDPNHFPINAQSEKKKDQPGFARKVVIIGIEGSCSGVRRSRILQRG